MAPPQGFQWQLMVTCNGAGSSYELIARLDKLAARPGYQVIYSVGWDGHLGRGNPASRPAAMYASTGSGHGPYDGHGRHRPRISPRDRGQTKARRDPSRLNGDAKILARAGTARQQHRQRAQPKTRQGCSGSQTVNNGGDVVSDVPAAAGGFAGQLVKDDDVPR